MAGYLVILLPFPLAVLLFRSDSNGARAGMTPLWYTSLAAVMVMGVILLVTQSRGAWLAVLVFSLLMLSLRWKRGWLSFLVAAITIVALVSIAGSETLLGKLLTDRNLASVSDRLDLWQRAVLIIRDFPFTGIGMGAFGEVVELFYPYRFVQESAAVHTHNLALQVGVELGLPGLVGWLALLMGLGSASYLAYRGGRAQGNTWLAGSGAAYLCSLIAYFVHGMVDAVTWGAVRPAPLVWAIWGGIAALASMHVSSSHEANPTVKLE
jgi:putative inorganic carbon (HCO3(-)) transporter